MSATGRHIGSFTRSYPAVAGSVPLARARLVDFAREAGACAETVDALRLAASEALTNAVLHAYRGDAGDVHVTAALAGDEIWILIADEGCGLQVSSPTPGLGMGLALIASVTDYLAVVERSGGGTELRMRFSLESAPDDYVRGSVSSATSAASPRFSTTK